MTPVIHLKYKDTIIKNQTENNMSCSNICLIKGFRIVKDRLVERNLLTRRRSIVAKGFISSFSTIWCYFLFRYLRI